MGTKAAPTYANLVLGFLEETLYNKAKAIYGQEYCEFLKNNIGIVYWTIVLPYGNDREEITNHSLKY